MWDGCLPFSVSNKDILAIFKVLHIRTALVTAYAREGVAGADRRRRPFP